MFLFFLHCHAEKECVFGDINSKTKLERSNSKYACVKYQIYCEKTDHLSSEMFWVATHVCKICIYCLCCYDYDTQIYIYILIRSCPMSPTCIIHTKKTIVSGEVATESEKFTRRLRPATEQRE